MWFVRLAATGVLLGLAVAVHPSACPDNEDCSAVDEEEIAGPQSGRMLIQTRVHQKQEDVEQEVKSAENEMAAVSFNCAFMTCLNHLDRNREKDCRACIGSSLKRLKGSSGGMRTAQVGVNGVPAGYIADELEEAEVSKTSRLKGSMHSKMSNFPGDNTTSFMSWDEVADAQRKSAAQEWSGHWWRGNEMGLTIKNPFFWSDTGINPMSMVTGILPSQHAAIRPVLEEMFHLHCDDRRLEVQGIIMGEINDFLDMRKRRGLRVQDDIKALVYQILNNVALGRKVPFKDAQDFVKVQSEMIALDTASQLLNPAAYKTMMPVRQKVTAYIKEYAEIIKKRWGETLEKEDCSPSTSCVVQAASALFDAFYSIGGLTVSTTISTGLGLLLSDDSSNPMKASFSREQAAGFCWEIIRFFPPVAAFPHWTSRPYCAGSTAAETNALNAGGGKTKACPLGDVDESTGFPTVNQYQGGERVVPNIANAQSDAKKWGADADKFVIRSLEEYGKSLGFAELAVDSSVMGGRMNRACPGKDLALMIGSTFFELFDVNDWAVPRVSIRFGSAPTYVSSFTLSSKQMVAQCGEICPVCNVGDDPSCYSAQGMCDADKSHCGLCMGCQYNPPDGWDLIDKAACMSC